VTAFYEVGFSQKVNFMVSMILGCAPNSVYCFNKTGFLIFFIDIYFILVSFKLSEDKLALYLYLVAKIASIIMPFLTLSPIQRLPF